MFASWSPLGGFFGGRLGDLLGSLEAMVGIFGAILASLLSWRRLRTVFEGILGHRGRLVDHLGSS